MSTLQVENLIGPTSGSNANKVIIPSGQTLDASNGFVAPAGHVIQVVGGEPQSVGGTNTTSSSYVNTGVSLTINLKHSNSKVRISLQGGHAYVAAFPTGMIETICRTSSTTYSTANDLVSGATFGLQQVYNSTTLNTAPHNICVIDPTPEGTTATYRVFFRTRTSGRNVIWQENNTSYFTFMLEEIAQ